MNTVYSVIHSGVMNILTKSSNIHSRKYTGEAELVNNGTLMLWRGFGNALV